MPTPNGSLLQAILDPVLVVQEDGFVLDCNAAAWRFMGAAGPQELIGRCLRDCPPHLDRGGESVCVRVWRTLQLTLATGSRSEQWVQQRPDGSVVAIDVSFAELDGSEPRSVLVHWHDISELRRTEDALRRSEERYRLLAENAHDVIWVMGLDARFTYVSPSVQYLRGYTPEEVMQQTMDEVLSPDSLRIVQESLLEIIEDVRAGRPVVRDLTEIEQPCKDGSTVWTEVQTTGMYDAEGQFIGLLGVTRNIGERRERDEQLRRLTATLEQRVRERTAELEEANAQLARASRHKDAFLATVSHELRTPLMGVLSFAQALEDEVYGALSQRQLHAVRRVSQAGNQLLLLINGILDLSRLYMENLTLQREAITVDTLCRLSLRALEPGANEPPHAVSCEIDRPDAVIMADRERIVQMLGHLLRNAAKFTPPGGRIELKTETDPAAGQVTFSVCDTGIGIEAADLPRLFQPFVQLDARLARQYPGLGIGLALVRGIAGLHGGSVGVESSLGAGSRFWVTLPLV